MNLDIAPSSTGLAAVGVGRRTMLDIVAIYS